MYEERRHSPRHPFECEIERQVSERSKEEPVRIRARVVDLSAQGAGIVGEQPPPPFVVLPWKFYVPEVPVPLQVLAQVRWVEPVESAENEFRFGLMFLP